MNSRPRRILVVEDSKPIRDVLRIGLETEGFEVHEAVDGIDALEALERGPIPDLILLDMLMPRMNGWEFVTRMRAETAKGLDKIPIIAVTATTEKVQRVPGEIQDVVRKPIDLDELYGTMRKHLA